jgi:hypothetical protein
VKGRLTPEVAAVLMRAVEAASDALFAAQGRHGSSGDGSSGDVPGGDGPGRHHADDTEHRQRRADALGLLAERALAAGFGAAAPVSGSRAERYQVMLHVEAATLEEEGEPGQSELEDGTRVTAETARRLSCDAGRVDVRHAADGSILDVGRKTRTVPPSLRRALEVRDRGCRFPGCGLRFTDAHHIVHWADGGETSMSNTVLVCRRHHRRVHEEGWRVFSDRDGREVVFFTPKGKALLEAPPLPSLPSLAERASRASTSPEPPSGSPAPISVEAPADLLLRRNRARGIEPDSRSASQRYRRDRDVPWQLEAAAIEALEADIEAREADLEATEADLEAANHVLTCPTPDTTPPPLAPTRSGP